MPNLGGWEFVILIGVLVLLFGAKRLPDMARSIGQSARVFKGEMKGMKNDDPGAKAPESSAVPAEPAPLPPAQSNAQPNTPPAPAPVQTSPEASRVTQPGQPGQ
jgi:sec-independent protein translocase protein TatA